jgi:hypothetical protein
VPTRQVLELRLDLEFPVRRPVIDGTERKGVRNRVAFAGDELPIRKHAVEKPEKPVGRLAGAGSRIGEFFFLNSGVRLSRFWMSTSS